jgi:hypothetical protein
MGPDERPRRSLGYVLVSTDPTPQLRSNLVDRDFAEAHAASDYHIVEISVPDDVNRRQQPERAERADDSQPLPTPNDKVFVHELVATDLEHRRIVGIRRYGTSLQPHNDRNALRDLYEELLDAACYARQRLYEEDGE